MVAVWHWITVATSVNQGVKRVLKGWQICEICGLACHFQSIESLKVNFSRRRTDQEAQHRWFLGGRHGGMGEEARRWLSMHGPASNIDCQVHLWSPTSWRLCSCCLSLTGDDFDGRVLFNLEIQTISMVELFVWLSKIHQNPYESLQCNGSFLAEEEHSTSRFEEAEVHQVHRSESHHQGGWRVFWMYEGYGYVSRCIDMYSMLLKW